MNLLGFQWCGDVFGGKALELAGRVVHPEHQRRGIATTMLDNLVLSMRPEFLTTYTRNPRILRMIHHVSSELYPLVADTELHDLAAHMRFAEVYDGALYHINRYDSYDGGLFAGSDPANDSFEQDGEPLHHQFNGLKDARNALVVAARVRHY